MNLAGQDQSTPPTSLRYYKFNELYGRLQINKDKRNDIHVGISCRFSNRDYKLREMLNTLISNAYTLSHS